MVPNGWEYKKLGLVAELQRGFDLPSAKRINGAVPIISSGGLSGYHNESKVKAPGIVTGRYGSIGDVFYVEEDFWPLNTSLWVKNFHNNEPKYLYYLLTNFDFKKFSDKTGVPGVNRNDLHTVKVGVPPLPEQRKIAQILSTWDRGIATTEKLIDASKQQKKALMQQLLTGKKRLVDPETGNAFEGDWENVSLKKLISEVKKTKEIEPNIIQLLTVKLHHKGVKASGKYPNATKGGRPYYKRYTGELIIGRQNLHNGGIAIVTEECDGLIASNAISSFKVTSIADVQFILNKMSTAHFIYTIDNLTGGTGQKEISVKELLKIKISTPSITEQQKIASVLTAADKDIELLEAKLAHFKQEKKALMQQLLTGKRRVSLSS